MTRTDLANRLDSLADVVAGWTSSVPPAAVTEWVAGQLRALARDVEAGGVEPVTRSESRNPR